jgi:membrane-bound lytic murein transglycosylase F
VKKDAFTQIRERGYLLALTNANSLNYFIYNGDPMGFQLSLLDAFADYLKVPLKIIAVNDIEKLYYYLDLNVADVLALNLPVTGYGKALVHFAQPIGETRLVLIQRKDVHGGPRNKQRYVHDFPDFSGDTIHVVHDPFLLPYLRALKRKTGARVILTEEKGLTNETLVRLVSEGKINFTLCDENLAMVLKRYYANIDANFILTNFTPYAWGIRKSSDSLLRMVNSWMTEIKKDGRMKSISLAYYNNPRVTGFFSSNNFTVKTVRLSPLDPLLRTLSKNISWDWRLLASLIYEESNFIPGQISSHNAAGLMQLMPETARKFGMDSASSLSQQLAAGVRYLHWLDMQLTSEIADRKERINFILASYNVGLGKVLAAREEAEHCGKNPNKWVNNVDYYISRKCKPGKDTQPEPDPSASLFGADGSFVGDIVERFHHYKNLLPK